MPNYELSIPNGSYDDIVPVKTALSEEGFGFLIFLDSIRVEVDERREKEFMELVEPYKRGGVEVKLIPFIYQPIYGPFLQFP